MSDGQVRLERDGAIARVTFDRPAARNAMTWDMYQQLRAICDELRGDKTVRVAVLRGAGGKAFIAGTDIAQFTSWDRAEQGIDYERVMEEIIAGLETLPMPTVAVIEGFAVGGGLALASVCDFRVATPGARIGVPIARTLGNCLSIQNVVRLLAALGTGPAKRILLLGDLIPVEEAHALGFILDVVEPGALDARVTELCTRLAGNAPITMRVSKEALRRAMAALHAEDGDLLRETYGSEDFHNGVSAFMNKRPATWAGR